MEDKLSKDMISSSPTCDFYRTQQLLKTSALLEYPTLCLSGANMSLSERFLRCPQKASAMFFFQASPPNHTSVQSNIPKLKLSKAAHTKPIETTQVASPFESVNRFLISHILVSHVIPIVKKYR